MNVNENEKTPRQCYEEAVEKFEIARREMLAQAKDIEGIKTKLYITNAELQLTKTELEATKKQLDDAQKEHQKTKDNAENMLVGSITAFATPIIPEGWLECNGQAVSRTNYARLFQKIGINFGAGDGHTTFQLPNLSGEFIRGWDRLGQIDAGRKFGSSQSDQIQTHQHADAGHSHSFSHSHSFTTNSAGLHTHTAYAPPNGYANGRKPDWLTALGQGWVDNNANHRSFQSTDRGGEYALDDRAISAQGDHTHKGQTNDVELTIKGAANITTPIGAEHGTETRPKNVALLYCIKY